MKNPSIFVFFARVRFVRRKTSGFCCFEDLEGHKQIDCGSVDRKTQPAKNDPNFHLFDRCNGLKKRGNFMTSLQSSHPFRKVIIAKDTTGVTGISGTETLSSVRGRRSWC